MLQNKKNQNFILQRETQITKKVNKHIKESRRRRRTTTRLNRNSSI
jgi:hypothetical protein